VRSDRQSVGECNAEYFKRRHTRDTMQRRRRVGATSLPVVAANDLKIIINRCVSSQVISWQLPHSLRTISDSRLSRAADSWQVIISRSQWVVIDVVAYRCCSREATLTGRSRYIDSVDCAISTVSTSPNWAVSNARRLANKLPDLHLFLQSNNLDLMCVTETWLNENIPNNLMFPCGYNV